MNYQIKQRWLHFFFVNELLHMIAIVGIVGLPEDSIWLYVTSFSGLLGYPIGRINLYISFYFGFWLLVAAAVFIRRLFRPARSLNTTLPRYPMPSFRTITHTTRDGVKLKVSISQSPFAKPPSKIMLLAEPLGQCGPTIYSPIMTWYGPEFTYVTWDYRGFFGDKLGQSFLPRLLSIPEHARDAEEVLRAAGFQKADVVVGHSMGTVVLFEMALLFPKSVGALVIMNGFHGHVYSTAFQPVIRVPFAGDCVSTLVELLLSHECLLRAAFYLAKPFLKLTLPLYALLFGSKLRRATEGDDYLLQFLHKYLDTLMHTPGHMERWLRMFQELDAHSVFHLLHTIKQPTLLISGYLDMLTPAMQSVEIARRIPHSIHYCDPFSSHATILESPEWALAEIVEFIGALKQH